MENWKDISGYEGQYMISDLGNVKSLSRISIDSRGSRRLIKERIMKLKTNRGGYLTAHLRGQKESWPTVHRLVALAFILNVDNKPTVNHIDGIKTNNTVGNLEWATESEQMLHAIATGLYTQPDIVKYTKYGEDAHSCKIRQTDLNLILKMRAEGKTYKKIGETFGIGISQVFRICKGQSWTWINNE